MDTTVGIPTRAPRVRGEDAGLDVTGYPGTQIPKDPGRSRVPGNPGICKTLREISVFLNTIPRGPG
eukprot:921606-Rhodomonas_salina.3